MAIGWLICHGTRVARSAAVGALGPPRRRGRFGVNRVHAPLWICSSIRASSCSPATASRCPPASRRAPSRTRSPPPTRSATPARSRRRCRSAAAASSAGSRSPATRAEAREHARAILGMDIRGLTVHELWIEGASQIEAEYYASVVFDRSAKAPLVMLSTKGGMDIEQVADEDPERDRHLHVDPLLGFQDFHGRRLAFEAGVDADVVRPVGAMLAKLYDVFIARGGDARRGQPADRHARARRSGARRQGHARRQRAVPPRRQRRAARPVERRTRRSGWPRSAG